MPKKPTKAPSKSVKTNIKKRNGKIPKPVKRPCAPKTKNA